LRASRLADEALKLDKVSGMVELIVRESLRGLGIGNILKPTVLSIRIGRVLV